MNKTCRFIFQYNEVISILMLCSCYKQLPTILAISFLIFFLILFTLKQIVEYKQKNKYEDKNILIPAPMLMTEISAIFITYSYGKIVWYYYLFFIISITILFLFYYFPSGFQEKIEKIFYNLENKETLMFILSFFLIFTGCILPFLPFISDGHISIEFFKFSNILVMISFGIIINYRSKKKKSFIIALIIWLSTFTSMIFVAKELGSCMVMIISDIIFLFILFIEKKNILYAALIIIITIFFIKIYMYIHDNKQETIELLVNQSKNYKLQIKRIFFMYSKNNQIIVVNNIAFDDIKNIDKATIAKWLLKFFKFPEYREIVPHENDSFTSSADYLFSIFFYANPIAIILISSFFAITLIVSIVKNFDKVYSIVPIFLLVQFSIHILGNTLQFPYTGITYPFLSYGPLSLIECTSSVILLIILKQSKRSEYTIYK